MDRFLDVDSYKVTHHAQYPPDTRGLIAYLEAREPTTHEEIVFFGLTPLLSMLEGPSHMNIEYMDRLLTEHGVPFNKSGWQYIQEKYGGRLPVRIYALPEGTVAKPGQPLMVVQSSDPKVPWVTTWVETQLSRVWYPTTVASSSRAMRRVLHRAWERSSDSPIESLDFKLHDFGSRGASSVLSAKLGGMAHLINFLGTDTVAALYGIDQYYWRAKGESKGFSIPAAEHSTVTSWGRDGEQDFFRHLVSTFGGPGKTVAFVADSYDLTAAVDMVADNANLIENSGTTVVVRPDSGDPLQVPILVLKQLAARLGNRQNTKDYMVLPDFVRVIQGDGMVPDTLEELVRNVLRNGFSIDNIAFGMGAGLLQKVDRDTDRFAYKVCGILRGGGGPYTDVVKDPTTDVSKRSKGWSEVNKYFYDMGLVYDTGVVYDEKPSWDSIVSRGKFLG